MSVLWIKKKILALFFRVELRSTARNNIGSLCLLLILLFVSGKNKIEKKMEGQVALEGTQFNNDNNKKIIQCLIFTSIDFFSDMYLIIVFPATPERKNKKNISVSKLKFFFGETNEVFQRNASK